MDRKARLGDKEKNIQDFLKEIDLNKSRKVIKDIILLQENKRRLVGFEILDWNTLKRYIDEIYIRIKKRCNKD